jgi:polysaccharide export outer membrane protein
LGLLILAVSMLTACTRPTLPEQTIWWTHSDDGPVDIDAIVSKYPELDGVVISAPEYMEELERERKKAAAQETSVPEQAFRVQPGSVLSVEVVGHTEFSRQVIVGPDGTYDFPLIGVMKLEGMTLNEFRSELSTKLRRFIKDPKVSVNMSYIGYTGTVTTPHYTAGWVRVLGQVNEGVIGITGRETILDIITFAGGLGSDAAWRDVRVIKQSPDRKRGRIIIVDCFNLLKFADLTQNIPITDRDIVYVPPHFPLGAHVQRDWDIVMKYVTGSQQFDHLVQYFEGRLRSRIKPLRVASD